MLEGSNVPRRGSCSVNFDVQGDASWEQLVAELRSMENQPVVIESDSADWDECGCCMFRVELKPPESDGEKGQRGIYYDLGEALIVIYECEILEAETSVGYVGITTATRRLRISRSQVELDERDEAPGRLVAA